jgi:hypothetical protein
MTLEPDAVDHYFKCCGFYGLASFETSRLTEQYLKVMVGDVTLRADSFAVNGHRGVIWGASLEWGIYCDRISWELCVMRTSSRVDRSIMSLLRCMDSTELAGYIHSEYSWKPSVAADFVKKFFTNYPALDGPYGPRHHPGRRQ